MKVCSQPRAVRHVLSQVQRHCAPVESEEALHAVVVVCCRVLLGELAELLVHPLVVVVAQEVAPEAEQGVHLLTQASACQQARHNQGLFQGFVFVWMPVADQLQGCARREVATAKRNKHGQTQTQTCDVPQEYDAQSTCTAAQQAGWTQARCTKGSHDSLEVPIGVGTTPTVLSTHRVQFGEQVQWTANS